MFSEMSANKNLKLRGAKMGKKFLQINSALGNQDSIEDLTRGYTLTISRGREALVVPQELTDPFMHQTVPFSGINLCLCSALLKSFREILPPIGLDQSFKGSGQYPGPDRVQDCLSEFWATISKNTGRTITGDSETPLNPPYYPGPDDPTDTLFYFDLEMRCIFEVILKWISLAAMKSQPNFKQKKNNFFGSTMFYGIDTAAYYFKTRCEQLKISPIYPFYGEPDPEKGRYPLARYHLSRSLIALCWAEIWYAVEYEIKAGICPYCGAIFVYAKNNRLKYHCGETSCKTAYNKAVKGPHWEAERKFTRISGRKPGRPKKNKTNN